MLGLSMDLLRSPGVPKDLKPTFGTDTGVPHEAGRPGLVPKPMIALRPSTIAVRTNPRVIGPLADRGRSRAQSEESEVSRAIRVPSRRPIGQR